MCSVEAVECSKSLSRSARGERTKFGHAGHSTHLCHTRAVDFVYMAKILVTCSSCNEDIPLAPEQVCSRICTNNGQAEYRFTCTSCDVIVLKSTTSRMVETLEAAGVEVEMWNLPAELFEHRQGPTLTHEDLLDFHIQLSDDTEVAEAIEQLVN